MSEIKTIPILFDKIEDCCGCGACLNICPRKAIAMKEDECGFIYPVITAERCIGCGQCKKVCAFQNAEVNNNPIECYAAISNNPEQSKKSASAGIFAAIAAKVIEEGGIVYGAAFDDSWRVHHTSAETLDQLYALQGSKYAHSDMERIYYEVKDQLLAGRDVLFSGTPCQIAGLQGYLDRNYENLLTVDIVCHGVPSNRMFQDYLRILEEKHGGIVQAFTFRDKTIGWGINGSAVISGKKVKIWQSNSSYQYYFGNSSIYRENCYKCKYACSHRPADITIGDFWGIEKQHPEFLNSCNWDENKGISLIIANTLKGVDSINYYKEVKCIDIKKSSFMKMSYANGQLSEPSISNDREQIIKLYINEGWAGLDKRFNQSIGILKYSSQIKNILPKSLKRALKKHI